MRFLLFLLFILALLACSNDVDPISYEEEGNNSSSGNVTPSLPALNLEVPASGHYAESVNLKIPENSDIYCGGSGAIPTRESSMPPGKDTTLTKTAIIRCAELDQTGKILTAPFMRTYFIGEYIPQLPVVSIAVDPARFNIMYTNCQYSVSESSPCYVDPPEPIHVDFFEKNAEYKWDAPAAFEMMGGYSRDNSKKSIKVEFREKYGQKNIKYPLFPKFGERKYKDFVLRNFGNSYNYDYYRDRLAAELTKGLDIDYMKGRYVVVYYNGKYYGIHDMRERANKNYFDTNYGFEENNLNLFKNYHDIKVGSSASYWELVEQLENSNDVNANYELIKANIDIENFTNYFISQIYFENRDWPGNNIRMWKTNIPGAKWKYFLFDVDFGFGCRLSGRGFALCDAQPPCSMIELVNSSDGSCSRSGTGPNGNQPDWPIYYNVGPDGGTKSTIIMIKLFENPEYREHFRDRAEALLTTHYTAERAINKLDSLKNEIPDAEASKDGCSHCKSTTEIKGWVANRSAQVLAEINYFIDNYNN